MAIKLQNELNELSVSSTLNYEYSFQDSGRLAFHIDHCLTSKCKCQFTTPPNRGVRMNVVQINNVYIIKLCYLNLALK